MARSRRRELQVAEPRGHWSCARGRLALGASGRHRNRQIWRGRRPTRHPLHRRLPQHPLPRVRWRPDLAAGMAKKSRCGRPAGGCNDLGSSSGLPEHRLLQAHGECHPILGASIVGRLTK
ncbi:hypothetical protein PVAP13_1KG220705 [Panicum virgatum]|uniref:Uncharacterized protein n=1 Tax=Panicum virgatum TaxID=38727 RepID=A0A8T0XDN7_PANVG|nr:hypothetical protein PVAP13_1KG220705 [Panicum virgatum]